MLKILIETQYLPTIGFFSLLYKADRLLLDTHEHYHKGSYRNRCELLSSQGRTTLSVPLQSGKNNQLPMTQVQINNEEKWALNHLRTIESCYGKSPYFEYYFHYFRSILEQEHQSLFELNLAFIRTFARILGLSDRIEFSDKFMAETTSNIDLKRDFISPKKKEQARLSSIFQFETYDQVFSEERDFEPNLSILDLIFCQGPEAVLYLARTIK